MTRTKAKKDKPHVASKQLERVAQELGSGARNHGPCLKPIALTTYLAKLQIPPKRPNGVPRRVVVMYAGTGSEMIGCLRAGWEEVIGIEREATYVEIARARIERWLQVPDHVDPAENKPEKPYERQTALF